VLDEETPSVSEFGVHGRYLWNLLKSRGKEFLTALDAPSMEIVCLLYDRLHGKMKAAEPKADIGIGIMIDKWLLMSAKFGMTPADRKALGVKEGKKRAEKPKTKLDGLTPEDFGAKT
jgi:hypothetical protein